MILTGDCRDILPTLDAESVDCCVTSPPYWGLRKYGDDEGQIGLENTLEEYIQCIRKVAKEIYRVLKPEGTFWLNLGDKYVKSGPAGNGDPTIGHKPLPSQIPKPRKSDYPDKCLMLIPARVAIALIDDGWILRSEIIWAKSNPLPSSATDRCTNSHEFIYHLVKQSKYYFNAPAIAERASTNNIRSPVGSKGTRGRPNAGLRNKIGGNKFPGNISATTYSGKSFLPSGYRNKRDVWTFSTAASENSSEDVPHYAKYPETLPRWCILAGCPIGGTVLDPFSGSGTTGKIALELGMKYIGIEMNPVYAQASTKKIGNHIQMRLPGGFHP